MSTSPYTFEDLSTPEGQAEIRQRILDQLTADGQPTASWAPSSAGGVENLRLDMVSGGVAFFIAQRIANMVNGRLLPLATDSAENGYWLTYLGKRFYKLTKRAATFTIQNIQLTAAASASAQNFADGDLWVASAATGNKYRLTLPAGVTIPLVPGGTANAPFQAENAGSRYSDSAGTIRTMVTAKAGITCNNVRPADFTTATIRGTSSGNVIGFFEDPDAPPAYNSVRFRIDSDGDIGTAMFSYSIDGGTTWNAGGPIPDGLNILPGIPGSEIGFSNGTSPSFVTGSIFTLRVNDNFLQRGADAETDEAFRARCSNRHPARSLIPLKAHIDLWAHEASPEVNKIASDADPNTPGGILVTIASQTGPATPAAQIAAETYILQRLWGFRGVPAPTSPTVAGSSSPEESAQVSSALAFSVKTQATVTVPRDQLAAVKAGADAAWNAYLASLPLGGQRLAFVEMERFYTILGDLGAVDVQGLLLNGVAADLTIPTGQVAVPLAGWTLAGKLSWVSI